MIFDKSSAAVFTTATSAKDFSFAIIACEDSEDKVSGKERKKRLKIRSINGDDLFENGKKN